MTTATQRRITPTAVRVLPADADRDTWLAARRLGIGSSDVPAILGLSERRTPLHVWHDKRGQLVDEQTEPMLWGTLNEETVAREWARRNRSVVQRVGLVAHGEQPWMLATLDRRVLECPLNRDQREACALEVKCRGAYTPGRWRGDVPDDVLAQTTWQMHVTGYTHLHVAVLIGGNDYRQTTVRADDTVTTYVLGAVTTFWRDHVLAQVRPPWSDDRAAAHLELDAALHPDRVGEVDVDSLDDILEYADASAAKSDAERRLRRARARLAEHADGARYVTFAGQLAYELAPVTRAGADLEQLAERWPDAYAAVVTERTHHQIRLSAAYRQGRSDD